MRVRDPVPLYKNAPVEQILETIEYRESRPTIYQIDKEHVVIGYPMQNQIEDLEKVNAQLLQFDHILAAIDPDDQHINLDNIDLIGLVKEIKERNH